MELQPETVRQTSLLKESDERANRLMPLLDRLNKEHGRNTIYLASCGIQQRWTTQFEMRTSRYTPN